MPGPGEKTPSAGGKRVPNPNPRYTTQAAIRKTQEERRRSLSSGVEEASPQRHGATSPMQQNHDTATLLIDLLARLVQVEAKVEEAVEQRTGVEARVKILELEREKLEEDLASEREAGERKGEEIRKLKEKQGLDESKMEEKVKELNGELQGLANKIRKMEEDKSSKEADEVEMHKWVKGKDEERKKEKDRLDKTKEEMGEMKMEMTSMKDVGVRREAAMKEELRKLKDELLKLGFLTATRPLPTGYPIGGSPRGTKSAAQ